MISGRNVRKRSVIIMTQLPNQKRAKMMDDFNLFGTKYPQFNDKF